MQSGRVAHLVRRLSTGDSRLKGNLNLNHNITKYCHSVLSNTHNDFNYAKRFYRCVNNLQIIIHIFFCGDLFVTCFFFHVSDLGLPRIRPRLNISVCLF